ncbi:butyrate kinase [candidate division TA06 bacterium]|uniref:Probable butyrate kinase n=1 Tax=candidate division TA06 bacterium TaxID=2250710 RepID=A0A933I9X0_UNCT6|nr:butyrate kinase [candidate division TA06 bacterium]
MPFKVLAINPGSTSTKIAVYEDGKPVFKDTLRHSAEELPPFKRITDQYDFRKKVIEDALSKAGINVEELNAIVGRGGLFKPIPSGTYQVNEEMKATVLESRYGEHASNLGCLIAADVARDAGCKAYIVDPVVVDEMNPLARYSGLPEIPRRSILHALNQKAVARRAAQELGKPYEQLNLIMVHLGGGISVGIHQQGWVTDVNNALNGDGPFAPERAGGLPTGDLVELCFSGKYTQKEIMKLLAGQGGCVSHLGTNDGREMENRLKAGDAKTALIVEAMAYQVAKTIGEMATVVKGSVDAIVLTGSFAYFKQFVDWVIERVSWMAPVRVYPGEDEMTALAEAGFRMLKGEEQAREYA